MNTDNLVNNENAFYAAIKDGPASAAEIRKSAKLDEDQVDELVEYWRSRLYLEVDDSGKTTKYVITDLAKRDMSQQYDSAPT